MTGAVTRGRRATVVVLLLLAAFFAQGLVPQHADAATRRRHQMFAMTNQDRSRHHTADLALDARLSRYAKQHSRQMARAGYLFHTADLVAKLAGRRWSIGGENVGVGSTLPGLERAFMRSTEHRQNILRKAFRHVAIGIFRSSGKLWVTVIFYG